jgi:hypothetical protein
VIYDFTDTEYAVMLDALAMAREKVLADAPEGTPTTNIDSASAKMRSWASPSGCGFLAVTGDDAEIIRNVTRERAAVEKFIADTEGPS